MIIGNGLVARAFEKYDTSKDIVIFASGVSNSLEQNPEPFLREQKLLKESLATYPEALWIYFGTCSVYDPSAVDSIYVQHKLRMEEIIKSADSSYIIFRLPQIVGESNNKATLLNYLYCNVVNSRSFNLWNGAVRYIVDIEDVVQFVSFVIDGAKKIDLIVNLTTTPSKITDIVECLEKLDGRKAIFNLVDKGEFYSIPAIDSDLTLLKAGIVIDDFYLKKVLHKYYKK